MGFADIFNRVEDKEEIPPPVCSSPEEFSLLLTQEEYFQKKEATRLMRWNRRLRLMLSAMIVAIVSLWLLLVAAIVCFSGFGFWGFCLQSNVLITLIGGSSVNVIGLLLVIVNDIFPGSKKTK